MTLTRSRRLNVFCSYHKREGRIKCAFAFDSPQFFVREERRDLLRLSLGSACRFGQADGEGGANADLAFDADAPLRQADDAIDHR